jgi:cytochrome b subunit of formate dehydrogenase
MALENIVGPECRRCYACVKACPQVSKSTKEFVLGFRRGEKFVHAYVASLIFFLAATGIFMFHFSEAIPGWQKSVLKLMHTVAGFLLLLAPLVYFRLDRSHMKRALKNVFRFGRADLAWLGSFGIYLKSPGRQQLPSWTEFNTYHKFWFSYLLVILPVLGLTGIINLFGEASFGPMIYDFSYWIHAVFALITDVLVLTHIYFKLLRHIFKNVSDMSQCFQQSRTLHYPFMYDHKSRTK